MLTALVLDCIRISQLPRVGIVFLMILGGCGVPPFFLDTKPAKGGESAVDNGSAAANDAGSLVDGGLGDACSPADAGASTDAGDSTDADAAAADSAVVEAGVDSGSAPDSGGPLAVWFVSSVTGSDSNDGRSEGAPFATLAKLQQSPLVSGDTVYLARGSFWREELIKLPAGTEVRTYGDGERPVIDGSDIAPNLAFQKSAGFTNLYEVPWTHGFASDGGKSAHRVWEDGTRLRRVQDLATCDSTPGSFYAPRPTAGGPDLVYVHASDSSDISNNGRVYELTRRRWALQLYRYREHAFVYSVHTRRNAHADGSLAVDGLVSDCLAEDGRIHNVFIRGTAESTTAWKIEPPSEYGAATMFVTHESDIDLPGVVYRGCKAIADGDALGPTGGTNESLTVGFYGHTSSGRKIGTAIYEECETSGVVLGFGFRDVDYALYYRSNSKASHVGVGTSPVETLAVLGGHYHTWRANGSLVRYNSDYGQPKNIIIRGVRLVQEAAYSAPIWIDRASSNIEITRCTFVQLEGCNFRFVSGSYVVTNNVFYGKNFVILPGSLELSFTSDHNLYFNTNPKGIGTLFQAGGPPTIAGLPAWTAATGWDLNSIEADPLFIGSPLLGEFLLAADSPAYALAAGADYEGEELDAILQVYRASLNATLTP